MGNNALDDDGSSPIRVVLLDLDGTVYCGDREIAGASRFIANMTANGVRCMFVTNRSNRPTRMIRDHLRGYGIACRDEDIVTTADATVQALEPGSVFLVGEDGFRDVLVQHGFALSDADPDYVVVSFDRHFNYAKLKKACGLIHGGARFIATNPDCCLLFGDELLPGTGAMVAAIAAGSGTTPTVLGKPQPLLFEIALARSGCDAAQAVAVGDNLDTDILAGNRAGMRTALMLTGHSTPADIPGSEAKPTWVCETFDDLANRLPV